MKMAFVLLALFLTVASSCKRGEKAADTSLIKSLLSHTPFSSTQDSIPEGDDKGQTVNEENEGFFGPLLSNNPFSSIRDSIVEGDDPSSPRYYKGRIVNGKKEGFWIENQRDSMNYKGGKRHGKCTTWGGVHHNIRYVNYYEEGKEEGKAFWYEYGYGWYTTVNYKDGIKQGYEYTYRLKDDSLINTCRYDEEGYPYRFMGLYKSSKESYLINQDYHYRDKKISINMNDECFIQEGEYEFVGEVTIHQSKPDTAENADRYKDYVTEICYTRESASPILYNKCGEWVKYYQAVPVEYCHYDHRGVLEYRHQITDYELNGSYAKYRNGVLAESGKAKAIPKQGTTTKEKLQIAKVVAVTALTIATALGGRGGGIGGSNNSNSLLYEARHLQYDYVLDGDIVFYNPDGTVNRIHTYRQGELVSGTDR